jgi:hypothetical protein
LITDPALRSCHTTLHYSNFDWLLGHKNKNLLLNHVFSYSNQIRYQSAEFVIYIPEYLSNFVFVAPLLRNKDWLAQSG